MSVRRVRGWHQHGIIRDVAAVEAEFRNLAETAAKGGAVPVIIKALELLMKHLGLAAPEQEVAAAEA